MALRQYPDTEEVKARNVGMYKSPARSTKKPKTPTPVKRADEEPLGTVMHVYVLRIICVITECVCVPRYRRRQDV